MDRLKRVVGPNLGNLNPTPPNLGLRGNVNVKGFTVGHLEPNPGLSGCGHSWIDTEVGSERIRFYYYL